MRHAWWSGLSLGAWLLTAACAPDAVRPAVGGDAPEPTATAKKEPGKPARQRGEVTSIGFDEFFALHQQDRTLTIDSRPAFYYRLGHIPGAVSLPKNAGEDAVSEMEVELGQALAKGRKIVVYCSGILCPDARTVARRIAALGHPVSIFSGGWDTWRDAGLPLE